MSHKALAKKNYEKFHARKIEKETSIEFTMPKALTFLADGVAIEYLSNKANGPARAKGKRVRYKHDFGTGVKIYLHPNRKWLLVGGGNFRVTDWMRG